MKCEESKAGTWFLTCVLGPLKGKEYVLVGDDCTLGRSSENDIRIEDDRLSRIHARVFTKDHKLFIEDCESKNGIYVNQAKVLRTELNTDDEIVLGTSKFIVGQEKAILKPKIGIHNLLLSKIRALGHTFKGFSWNSKASILGILLLISLLTLLFSTLKPNSSDLSVPKEPEGGDVPPMITERISATDEEVVAWKKKAQTLLRAQDFRTAHSLLSQIEKARPNDHENSTLRRKIESDIRAQIQTYYESGLREFEKLYFDHAIRDWQKALVLSEGFDEDMTPKILTKIEEAEHKRSGEKQ